MIYDIVQECLVKQTYKDKVMIIGSPFKVDNQLDALFHQNVIDWVYTEDADLICCGANIITSINKKSPERKCWMMMYKKMLWIFSRHRLILLGVVRVSFR